MKIHLLAFSMIVVSSAFAGSTVCAGKTAHYVNNRFDSGPGFQPGQKTGYEFLSKNGEIVRKHEFFAGGSEVGEWDLTVMIEDQKLLHKEGNQIGGSRVYSATLAIYDNAKKDEAPIVNEQVTCRNEWAMLP